MRLQTFKQRGTDFLVVCGRGGGGGGGGVWRDFKNFAYRWKKPGYAPGVLFLFIKNAVSIIDLVNSKGLVLCHLVIEQ